MFYEATIGILVVDRMGTIVMTNPFLDRMFGYKQDELVGRQVEVLLPDYLKDIHKKHREKYYQNPKPRAMGVGLSLLGLHSDGDHFPLEISLSHITVDGKLYVISYVNDVTEQVAARKKLDSYAHDLEREVQSQTEQLKKSLEKERELGQLKSRFVSMASHEFRTPLSSILSSASIIEMYLDREIYDKQYKHIQRIRSSVNNLTTILNDFLSLEKMESGKLTANLEEFDLHAFILDLIEEVSPMLKESQHLHYEHDGQVMVRSDPHLLKNIMLNLSSNAIKYSSKGKISIRSIHEGHHVKISVCDEGIGIPEQDQKYMFTLFFRATNASSIKGTGLGLHIVKRYLDLLGGAVRFTSEEGKGTCFYISLPQS